MILLISLGFALLFFTLFQQTVKKYPVLFYIAAIGFSVFIVHYYNVKMYESVPKWVTTYLIGPFKRGAFSTATFIIVMMIGAVSKKSSMVKKLFTIRGEMSIIACIFTFAHNIVYGIRYFPQIFTNPGSMKPDRFAATLMTIFMIGLLIPLFITSFRTVRQKMNAKTWKKVQMLAYPFFGMIYIHIMILFLSNPSKHILNIGVYTVIFGGYALLRIKKAAQSKTRKLAMAS